MRFSTSALAAAGALFASGASAQVRFCPQPDQFCAEVGVPATTAASGGNIYFQMQALESFSWVAIGTGSRMSGSTMFIIYSDGAGNVTVSPRSASGHSTPQPNSNVAVQVLDGSGVADGIMTANFLCANCAGVIDPSGSDTPWIAAWRSGSPIASSDISAGITQHNSYTRFSMDLSAAAIQADSNPFNDPSANGGANGGGASGGSSGGIAGGSSEGASSAGSTVNLILLHGIIMAVTFVFMYPVGAILMPLVGKWLVHAGWQMVAFMAMWAGFGVGYSKAKDGDVLFKQSHTVLGTIVCCGMIIQPVIGFLHHQYYKKHQSRGPVSYAHIWYGRIIMFVGILNGGLGLKLSNASNTFTIAYSVVAAIVGIAYAGSSYVGEMRRSRAAKKSAYSAYSPTTGTQGYKPQGRVQYSPVQSNFSQQPMRDQSSSQYEGGQYGPRDQYQQQQYGSYR